MKKKTPAHLFDPKQHTCWLAGHPQAAPTVSVTIEGSNAFVTYTFMAGNKRTEPITREFDKAQSKAIIAQLKKK